MVGMEQIDTSAPVTTARSAGLVACRRCARVWPGDTGTCGRCGAWLISRDGHSLFKVWFWWLLGIAAYIPANLYPILETRRFFFTTEATIIGGALELWEHGAFAIAGLILLASVAIPVAKLLVIAFLALTVGRRGTLAPERRHRLFHFVEFIGRWSMVDVFIVAIMSSLIQFSVLASIKPGPASLAFALSVIFTMISAQSFDPRLIWDEDPQET